mmetsp:Transcript_11519/g.24553  ORF Transcript_11519/g.24553 Transcript_11519/m.24553 type:complete len:382 (+) Transcript_11519:29-1174(+)
MNFHAQNNPTLVDWAVDEDEQDAKAEDVLRRTSDEVMRRASEMTTDIDEFDLSENYQNAIDCLISCESIIRSLQEELAAKDKKIEKLEEKIENMAMDNQVEELAAKDKKIKKLEEKIEKMSTNDQVLNLEDKIVRMSLDLALTKARADSLEHKLKSSSTSNRTIDTTEESDSDATPTAPAPENPIPTRWQPKHKHPSKRQSSWARMGQSRGDTDSKPTNTNNANTSFTTAKTSFTTATSAKTLISFSSNSAMGLEDSNTSRLSNFGQFLLARGRQGSWRHGSQDSGKIQIEFPPQADIPDAPIQDEKRVTKMPYCNDVADAKPRRRPPSQKRMDMHKKSSRSFLEANGVIFPVSSFEVLKKGCLMNKGLKGSSNEEWPAFR